MPPFMDGAQQPSSSTKPFVSEATSEAERTSASEEIVVPETTTAPQAAPEPKRSPTPEEIPALKEPFEDEGEILVFNVCLTPESGTRVHGKSSYLLAGEQAIKQKQSANVQRLLYMQELLCVKEIKPAGAKSFKVAVFRKSECAFAAPPMCPSAGD